MEKQRKNLLHLRCTNVFNMSAVALCTAIKGIVKGIQFFFSLLLSYLDKNKKYSSPTAVLKYRLQDIPLLSGLIAVFSSKSYPLVTALLPIQNSRCIYFINHIKRNDLLLFLFFLCFRKIELSHITTNFNEPIKNKRFIEE